MKRAVVVVAVALLAAACGGSEKPSAPTTFDVKGKMTLTSSDVIGDGGDGCLGSGGFDDMRPGASVVIYDAKGKKIAIGELEDGRASSIVRCEFPFKIADVPATGKIYSIEVSHRGEIPFKRAGAKKLSLTLG